VQSLNAIDRRGGGVCASLCLVNVLWALRRHRGQDLREFRNARDFVRTHLREIDRAAARGLHKNIALGLNLDEIETLLRGLLRLGRLDDQVWSKERRARDLTGSPHRRQSLWIGVFSEVGPGKSPHAVVILRHDAAARTLLISDPNDPAALQNLEYEIVRKDRFGAAYRLRLGLSHSSMVRDVTLERILEIGVF